MPQAIDIDNSSTSINLLRDILGDLNDNSKDVQVSMVATTDGLTMLALGGVVDADRVGAMCSDLLSLCRSAALELQRGEVEHVLMKASHGCMLLTPAGPQAVLAIMARPDSNLGMLMLDARQAAAAIPGAL
jgi:predicted regulator of Ras-like GTPase activity (Roadblock/LC7/MglB family)